MKMDPNDFKDSGETEVRDRPINLNIRPPKIPVQTGTYNTDIYDGLTGYTPLTPSPSNFIGGL